MSEEKGIEAKGYSLVPVAVTLLYWYWESIASGNIRVDLLIIYPALLIIYIVSLWRRFKFYAVLISIALMLINFGFLLISYDLFDKHPG